MPGKFTKCFFKITEVYVLKAGNLFVSKDFRSQQPERSLDEPCGLTKRHARLCKMTIPIFCQQMAETVFKQSGDLFTKIALNEGKVMKVKKFRLDLFRIDPPPKLCPINRIRVEDGAVFMKKIPELHGITVVLQFRSG